MKLETVVLMIRICLGVNFLWFGMLKFFPGVSPAEALATQTIEALGFGWLGADLSIKLLAVWEVSVGVGFLWGRYLKFFVRLFMLHMLLTFTPFFFFPELCFGSTPMSLSLVGQYIIKNLVFIMGGTAICIVEKEHARREV